MAAVARRWLEPPYALDGWRIDVANMTGRYGELGLTARGGAGGARRARATDRRCSSPSTATTTGATSSATAGTGR